jgi:hypothetical protein
MRRYSAPMKAPPSLVAAMSLGLTACAPAAPEHGPDGKGGTGSPMNGSGSGGQGGWTTTPQFGGTAGTLGGAAGSDSLGGVGGTAGGGIQGGSGGTADTGSGQGNAGGGATGPGCPQGAFLCDGFESQTVGEAPAGTWTTEVRNAGQLKVEDSRFFSGKKSIHVTGQLRDDKANITAPLAIGAKSFFVRFMMYTASYPASSGVHTRLVRMGLNEGTGAGDPESSFSLATYNGTSVEKVNAILLRNTATKLNDPALKNHWICWEFAVDMSGGPKKVEPQIWLDGRQLALAPAGSASHGQTTPDWNPIPIEVFYMGLDGFQSDPVPADFWIDDLVVHSQRIGCPAGATP